MSKMMRVLCLAVVAAVVFGVVQTIVMADHHEKKAKHNIKEVMKKAHKDGLLKKVLGGDASIEEKHELLDLYISLVENKPPKGEMDSWHKLAGGAALAAAKVVVGREGAGSELKSATTCGACHKPHKPS